MRTKWLEYQTNRKMNDSVVYCSTARTNDPRKIWDKHRELLARGVTMEDEPLWAPDGLGTFVGFIYYTQP